SDTAHPGRWHRSHRSDHRESFPRPRNPEWSLPRASARSWRSRIVPPAAAGPAARSCRIPLTGLNRQFINALIRYQFVDITSYRLGLSGSFLSGLSGVEAGAAGASAGAAVELARAEFAGVPDSGGAVEPAGRVTTVPRFGRYNAPFCPQAPVTMTRQTTNSRAHMGMDTAFLTPPTGGAHSAPSSL